MRNKQELTEILTAHQNFLKSDTIYKPDQILDVMKMVRHYFRFAYMNKKMKYFNVPCAFDIETTSFYAACEKVAIMYEWTFGIFGAVIIGRTWDEFITMIKTIVDELDLTKEKRLIIYVHNLAFEFQFLRKYFVWESVFAVKSRTPVYCLTTSGIEFRCSYLLSGYSLAKVAENLHHTDIKKLVGDLDYNLLRHSKTPLTSEEIGYCVNDVKIILAYIAEKIEQDGDIAKIPLTKTGYVRTYCRNQCFYEPDKPRKKSFKRMRYKEMMQYMNIDLNEYIQLKRAFQGGFTHANAFFSGKELTDVTSYDFTSSYPAVMIAEKFPMSKSEEIVIESKEDLEKNLKLYCCLFDIEFTNLQATVLYENYISFSHCWKIEQPYQVNNGRVVNAAVLRTTLTEQDYFIIKRFYTWDSIKIKHFRRYKKGYLPKDFILAILQLYKDKTTLKGVAEKEIEYLKSKEMLNSCYGMSVTDPVREDNIYTDHWLEKNEKPEPNIPELLDKYNNNPGRFLFYPWGVWVTAYARKNLFTGIMELKTDYIYSDTDSIKARNMTEHLEYIRKYNENIIKKLEYAAEYHGFSKDLLYPETIKGEKKPLGVWDFDGHYARFKTLGAKRYMTENDRGQVNITVAGLNKKIAVPFLCQNWYYDIKRNCYVNDPFTRFSDNLYVPAEYTGKMTHTYIDEERTGVLVDYTGNAAEYKELSGVHLESADYSLSISREYRDYLIGLKDVEI